MSPTSREPAPLYAERYRIDRVLGRGGMGLVSQVFDARTGATLALKQLELPVATSNPERRVALFQREYHILTQLAHPNVVRVFDYGVVDGMPFYTMELLAGLSVRELSPLPWRAACAYALELCSALAVLHGRGFIHRDLTPSNVLVTDQRIAKLIDFGAMAPMGPNDAAVGTPPYMAPETLKLGTLDGRVDVFGLGALTYFMLLGRHAYPALTLQALPEAWLCSPASPSTANAEIPEPLARLVLSMLSIVPQGRPLQMAEVTQRLCELLGRKTPPIQAPQLDALLVTPKLVGRDPELKLAQAYAARTTLGTGATLLIAGDAGSGRSRLLEAFGLEAKLAGCLVLNSRANAAQDRPFGVIQDLLVSAIVQAPGRAGSAVEPVRAALEGLWPSEIGAAGAVGAPRMTPELQSAIVVFFERLAALCPTALSIDDVPFADVASLQVLVHLARETRRHALLLVCSATPSVGVSDPPLHQRLREQAEEIRLRPFAPRDSHALLVSIVGEVPGLPALGDWVHRVADGRPKTSLELVAHLVRQGAIAHSNGQFRLVADLEDLALPQGLEQVMQARLGALSPGARAIVEVVALGTRLYPLRSNRVLELVAEKCGQVAAYDGLTELLGQRILEAEHEYYGFVHPSFAKLVQDQLHPEDRRACSARIGALFAEQGPDFAGIAAHHYQQAGEIERAHELLFAVDGRAIESDMPLALHARSAIGQAMYERMLEQCKQRGDSPAILFRFRKVMLQLAAIETPELTRYAVETLEQLRFDVGLDSWERFADAPDPMTRLVRCFEVAQQRWTATDPSRRGLEPSVALRELATCVALLVGAYAPVHDTRGIDALPAIIEPLRALAPVLDLVYLLAKSAADSVVRGCFFLEQRQQIVQRLREPVAGMDALTQMGAYLLSSFYVSLELVSRGNASGVAAADELEAQPMYAVLGKQLRLVHALSQGEFEEARRWREDREMLALQSPFSDQHRETSVRWEALANYRAGDLLGIRELVHRQEQRAARFPGTRPIVRLLRAQYQMLCGEHERALREIRAGQALAPPLQHTAWRELALLEMEALLALGRHEDALALVEQTEAYLVSLGFGTRHEDRLILARAQCLLAAGDTSAARAVIAAALPDFEPEGPNGVPTGALYETLASIALCDNDLPGFQLALAHVKRVYMRGRHPGLVARFERLVQRGRQRLSVDNNGTPVRSDMFEMTMTSITQVRARGADAQLRQLLGIVLDEAKASAGYLYRCSREGQLQQLAQRGGAPVNPVLELQLHRHIASVMSDDVEVSTVTGDQAGGVFVHTDGVSYVPLLLRDYERPGELLGIAVVASAEPLALGAGLVAALSRTFKALLSG